MNLQQQSHNEGSGILCMGISGVLLPLTLFSDKPETTEPGDGIDHWLWSVL